MKIAVEGCAHGELEKIYDTIAFLEEKDGVKIDLLICCGDFQSTRNTQDLNCMAVPQKYRDICTFYKYYSGEKQAPILTIFIGGNHEASNYLSELAYGGWVAPNIFYLGYAGVVQIAGVRIAGLSGIFKGRDYKMGHFEKAPFSTNTIRSVYHIRNLDVFRLKQLSGGLDIALSHDWPRGVYHHGNLRQLLRFKPFFQDEIKSNSLGSQPTEELLHHLKPSYWFSAHLHCKFSALIRHISEDDSPSKSTKFLALDKCLPNRRFLQILDIAHQEDKEITLEYDLEWLTILSLTNHLLSIKQSFNYMPGPGSKERWKFTPTKEEMDFVFKKFSGNLKIPLNFSQTVQAYSSSDRSGNKQPAARVNPQTMAFCDRLGIDDPIALLLQGEGKYPSSYGSVSSIQDPIHPNNDLSEDKSVSTGSNECLAPKPRLQGLKLPSPKMSYETPASDSSENTPVINSTTSEDNFSQSENQEKILDSEPSANNPIIESRVPSGLGVEDLGSQGPMAKKFKRRNAAMYMSADDD
ncbi:lariat debranching enzyme [Thrips palmi]|uniref:Lariat debranching enzyme n=1 Tax=Thrips palmi TaxID=161013 RepID=A0A6P9A2T3_THRPL|nr:lariat debranching enzyme [Thrips palmi]